VTWQVNSNYPDAEDMMFDVDILDIPNTRHICKDLEL
jgi:hypothetical protein